MNNNKSSSNNINEYNDINNKINENNHFFNMNINSVNKKIILSN